jgi:hypothetical protein
MPVILPQRSTGVRHTGEAVASGNVATSNKKSDFSSALQRDMSVH